jgi:hypothetical protein
MRKLLSVVGAIVFFFLVGLLIYQGGVNLSDYSTQLAVLLTTLGIGVLAWGFKPEIANLVKGKKRKPTRPKLIQDLLVTLLEFQQSWYNKWRRSIENLEIRKPENGQISWYSDELRRIMAQINTEEIPMKPDLKKQIDEFVKKIGEIGGRIHRIFPDEGASIAMYDARYRQGTIQPILQQCDEVVKSLNYLIPQIKDAFPLEA